MKLQEAIKIFVSKGKQINVNFDDGLFEYAECSDGFEFCRPTPQGHCGSVFYKVRANGDFSYSPCPGFGRPFEEEGWSEFKPIEIDVKSNPPVWRDLVA